MHEYVYSDDRRWFGRTTKEVAAVAIVAHVLAQDACAPSNHAKMHYTSLRLQPDITVVRCPGDIVVHGPPVRATMDVPCVPGVALEPGAVPPNFKGSFLKQASRVRAFLRQYKPNFLLSARAVLAYLAFKIDSLAQASTPQDTFHLSLQPTLSSLYRVILWLPHDTPPELLMMPVEAGGWGCRSALVRGHLNFPQGFVCVYEGRSAVCRAVLREVCSTTTQVQGADAQVFRRLCSQYELVFSPLSNNHVAAPELPQVLVQAETLYVTTYAGVQ